jgi:hypothetical protein
VVATVAVAGGLALGLTGCGGSSLHDPNNLASALHYRLVQQGRDPDRTTVSCSQDDGHSDTFNCNVSSPTIGGPSPSNHFQYTESANVRIVVSPDGKSWTVAQ